MLFTYNIVKILKIILTNNAKPTKIEYVLLIINKSMGNESILKN